MRAAAAAVLAVAVVATGCTRTGGAGGGDGIRYDQATVQRFLAAEVARTSPDLPVGAVTCPPTLDATVGASPVCAVVLDGVETAYVVQVLAGRRFEARPRDPIVDLRRIEAQIAEKAGEGTTATCGPARVVQMTPTQKVTCQITGAGGPRRAVVTADPDGTVRVADA